MLDEQWSKWMDTMLDDGQGFSDWPHTDVPVNVVGWAVRDRDTLGWSDDSVPVYVNDISEDAPQCSGDTHDMSLWLTEGFGAVTGAIGDSASAGHGACPCAPRLAGSVQRGSFGTKIHIRM